jgi:hypothetical protein
VPVSGKAVDASVSDGEEPHPLRDELESCCTLFSVILAKGACSHTEDDEAMSDGSASGKA